MKMMKNWIALLLALCMMAALGVASACCADACYTGTSGMDETQTMEETCPCMMDGKGVNGCPCISNMCGEDCLCVDGKSCMQDGMRADGCMCEKQCACENECACAEKTLEMLTAEMNAVFEKNMDLWNRFFGMMDKQPDMDMSYADYLTAQQLSDLAYFRPELGDCLCAPVPLVRIAEAFMDLICALCAGDSIQKLEIQSVNGAPLDDLSRDVAAVLQMKCGRSLVLL